MGDNDKRCPQHVAQLQNKIVQQLGAHRIKACRWLIQEEHCRIHGKGAGKACTLAHASRYFGRVVVLKAGKPCQGKLQPGQGPYFSHGKGSILLQWQGYVLGQGHGAPESSLLEEDACLKPGLCPVVLGARPVRASLEGDSPVLRLLKSHEDAQQR